MNIHRLFFTGATDIRDTRPAVDFQSTPSLLQRERTSGYSAPVDGVYSSLKLSVSVDNVKIELYNGDSDLVNGYLFLLY